MRSCTGATLCAEQWVLPGRCPGRDQPAVASTVMADHGPLNCTNGLSTVSRSCSLMQPEVPEKSQGAPTVRSHLFRPYAAGRRGVSWCAGADSSWPGPRLGTTPRMQGPNALRAAGLRDAGTTYACAGTTRRGQPPRRRRGTTPAYAGTTAARAAWPMGGGGAPACVGTTKAAWSHSARASRTMLQVAGASGRPGVTRGLHLSGVKAQKGAFQSP